MGWVELSWIGQGRKITRAFSQVPQQTSKTFSSILEHSCSILIAKKWGKLPGGVATPGSSIWVPWKGGLLLLWLLGSRVMPEVKWRMVLGLGLPVWVGIREVERRQVWGTWEGLLLLLLLLIHSHGPAPWVLLIPATATISISMKIGRKLLGWRWI